ncbi:DUF3159 domain-containing protein [Salinibacterium soli]|uniref:DUF3159 domain-containing protein n=1 Tax=Antiquaquibacter soli TaxID=3064523 RepID=A0ABT9BM45_9MICO|nr:DUF3159 domain-containing protein [Protaetiibacter sp. WY-16]MDO7882075.1 DUF3159 domain-containing protein [Protaetiibacter sp. WY-16]
MSDRAPDAEPDLREAFAAAAKRSGLGRVAPGETPTSSALLAAMGGVRGIVESVLPGLGFLVVYAITRELVPSVLIPLGIAVVFVVVRLVARQPWTSAVAGVLGVGISAGLALITGRPEDNFVPGFLINAGFLLALLVSLAVRWPLIGVIASLVTGEGSSWRSDRAKVRVALIATLLWCGLFAVRLGVELPLYFAGETAALATTKLVLGVPFYAALLWVTWLLVRAAWSRGPADGASEPESEPASQ